MPPTEEEMSNDEEESESDESDEDDFPLNSDLSSNAVIAMNTPLGEQLLDERPGNNYGFRIEGIKSHEFSVKQFGNLQNKSFSRLPSPLQVKKVNALVIFGYKHVQDLQSQLRRHPLPRLPRR